MKAWVVALDWKLVFSILIPGALVVVGWFAGSWLTSRREFKARRRDARVKGLETAFMRLADSANRDPTPEVMQNLETFVSELQLYGTPQQVRLTRKMVEAYLSTQPSVSFDALLEDLRDSLRKELQLESLDGLDGIKGIAWLRFQRPNAVAPPAPPAVSASPADLAADQTQQGG